MNARVYLVLLTCVCIDQHVLAVPTPVGTAVMHRNMRLRDPGAALPYPKGGDVYVCPAVLENGYLVVCRDRADVPRIAFLPNQDEWGHATARAWQSDTSLETNTIVIRRPLALQPGFLFLQKGSRYPVVHIDEATYTIAYAYGDFSRRVIVAKKDADFELPPVAKVDGRPERFSHLEQSLEIARDDQDELREKMEATDLRRLELLALLKQVGSADRERARLEAMVARAEAAYKSLLAYRPAYGKELTAWQNELTDVYRGLGTLFSSIEQLQMDIAPIRLAQIQRQKTREEANDLERSRVREASAHRVALEEETVPDLNEVEQALTTAIQDQAGLDSQVRRLEIEKGLVAKLLDELKTVRAQNETLDGKIEALTEELERLREEVEQVMDKGELDEQPGRALPGRRELMRDDF
jgi:hypothetical protein